MVDFIIGVLSGVTVCTYSYLIPYFAHKGWLNAEHNRPAQDKGGIDE